MQNELLNWINTASSYVWGPPMLVLLVGTGIYLTFLLRGLQFRTLKHSLYLALIKRKEDSHAAGDISHFQALMTALAATVGTGNIAGVATAIASGGPGALFWMWITGLFGMATKYAEAVLAVKYRVVDENGMMSGGPMYYLSRGLKNPRLGKFLGMLFALFAAIAAFGIGNMVQSNSVADAMHSSFGVPHAATGIVLAVATALVILGGIRSIARTASVLVPVMIVLYMLGGLLVLLINWRGIPDIVLYVLSDAFTPSAAIGGFAGATVLQGIRYGVARGVFSNESGLGSSPIAAAAAQTKNPVTQALVSMTQTFIDTIVVCSITGFTIIATGVWTTGKTGAQLTTAAFSTGLPGESGGLIVAVGLILFAYSTLLGWSYYGEKSVEYLFGVKSIKPYRVVFSIFVAVGAVAQLQLVWSLADLMNGLMAIPNLIGLLALSGVIVAETKKHFSNEKT
ncbi:MAG: sodium:alanine symporter family protein [candidate division KSB1 bacterium]|nr:sodium:alanine symporter family protein [candidate division KSB1 bacterium]MDZ7273345.1 sodium:alanine symporter family protein [candidate division KSB1 bacterium]MDZ7288007.1 sodium:alanine symporter family protein [candidate division KSB1 bacterium]MDZ7300141.1 sodium:alanine symporter family protein [candidate division KSB1 bacterium]MDZ7308471.1 sodium:alanine symporter family protein [candidate division KSB1 bacterium]